MTEVEGDRPSPGVIIRKHGAARPGVRYMVAGGAGFIGSHLCARLLAEGAAVLCVDNLSTGRLENMAPLSSSSRFDFVEHDIVRPLPEGSPAVDGVFHLASPASPAAYSSAPIDTLRANSEGTRHLLEFCAQSGAKFLFASTSEVYGDPTEHPQAESYHGNVDPTGPRSMYDEAKRYGEAMTTAFSGARKVDVRIARIFNTYGPNMDPNDGRLVPTLVTRAIRGEPLPVHGDGRQTRSLCYVDDIVDGLTRMMASGAVRGRAVNLGTLDERTVLEHAQLVRTLVGSDSPIVCKPAPVDDPRRRRPDIGLARRLIGWYPRVALEEGLLRTIEYFRREAATREATAQARPHANEGGIGGR